MTTTDQILNMVAARQCRAFSIAQAQDAGTSRAAVMRWVRRGAGTRVHPGVYVAGPATHDVETRRWAALLCAGDDALVGGQAALESWGIEPRPTGAVELLVTHRVRPVRGARIVQSRTVADEDRSSVGGRPTVSIERALVDVAGRRTVHQLCKLISEAAFRRLLDIDRLRRTMGRNPTRHGAGRLRRALAKYLTGENGADSGYEVKFLRLLERAGITGARANVWLELNGVRIRVDCYIDHAKLVIEIDPDNHLLPDKHREDELRGALCAANGLPVIRVRADRMEEGVAAILAHLAKC